ncbi:NAD-dependent epimerase/dehydratase family protein [Ilumatobacter sp.]|uniref:NAD-dependent epimerase/dehydratase family protein n=1 Tax=Ilumatobacter sp. TaxID=1967498 RepID=UPI003AF7EA55
MQDDRSEHILSGPVLVTGASGFIGAHTAAALLERGHDVRATVSGEHRIPDVLDTAARTRGRRRLRREPPRPRSRVTTGVRRVRSRTWRSCSSRRRSGSVRRSARCPRRHRPRRTR